MLELEEPIEKRLVSIFEIIKTIWRVFDTIDVEFY